MIGMSMTWLISKRMKQFRLLCGYLIAAFAITACEKMVLPDAINTPNKTGNVTLSFTTTNQDATRASTMSMYISKLNVQLFDEDGQKVFSTVKTQTKDDENFGTLSAELLTST